MLDAIIIADPHFGAIPVPKFKVELDKCLFNRLNHMKKLDMFIIAGDLFDMKEYSTSEVFKSVIEFLDRILMMTEKLGTKVVVLKGTRTHDDYQLTTLELIYNSKGHDRIKFIHSVTEDEVDGVRFLYVPEEYILDQDEYYKEYFSKKYDILIGHGTIDSIWRSRKQKRNDIMSAPVFNVEELLSVANYCYFGHEHMHKAYGKHKRFKYVGPMTVWEYDKTDAGYYIIHYSPENGLCREEYIENENAQVLIERTMDIDNSTTIDQVMSQLESIIDSGPYDGLKVKVTIDGKSPISVQAKNYIITKISLYSNVVYDISVRESEDIESGEEYEEEYHSINENQMPDDSAIAEFIKSKNGKDISLDIIRKVCGIGVNNDG